LLPPSKFILDDWKRFYSNEETENALRYLWENYDHEGYSVWFGEYKYPEDNQKIFMTLNLVGGYLQRLEGVRKYGFGSIIIFGEEPRLEIGSCFILRGKEVPPEMLEVPDHESYSWRRGDTKNEADKKLINDYFAWSENVGGKKFNQGKIFK